MGGGGATRGTWSWDLGPPPWVKGSIYKKKVLQDPGHKGGLLKRTDVHHRLSYNHKFFTSVHACAVQFNHTGSMCPLLGWGAPLSMYITRKIKGCGKRMCAMWLCVWGIPSRVRCPVLQWKHPGLQCRWSQVRIPLPGLPEADQAERQLGQRQATGGTQVQIHTQQPQYAKKF